MSSEDGRGGWDARGLLDPISCSKNLSFPSLNGEYQCHDHLSLPPIVRSYIFSTMSAHARHHRQPPEVTASAGATRSSRSSTLPSQQSPPLKHRYRHRHHQSASHRTGGHSHRFSADNNAYLASPVSNTSSLSPLGELLSPVRRNVAEGLSGVAGWLDREKDKDRWRGFSGEEMVKDTHGSPEAVTVNQEQLEQSRRKRKAAERYEFVLVEIK